MMSLKLPPVQTLVIVITTPLIQASSEKQLLTGCMILHYIIQLLSTQKDGPFGSTQVTEWPIQLPKPQEMHVKVPGIENYTC
jgi:hypothetical protein